MKEMETGGIQQKNSERIWMPFLKVKLSTTYLATPDLGYPYSSQVQETCKDAKEA